MLRIFSQYVPFKLILLMLTEGTLIFLSFWCAVRLQFWTDLAAYQYYTFMPDFATQALVIVAVFQLCFYYNDLYDLSVARRRSEQLVRVGESLGAGCLLLGLLYFLFPTLLIGRDTFFTAMALTAGSVVVIRVALDTLWVLSGYSQRVLIVGTGELALAVAREFSSRDDLHTLILGFVRPRNSHFLQQLFGRPVLGSTDELEAIANRERASRIIVAMEDCRGALPTRELVKLKVQGIGIEDAHTALAGLTGSVRLDSVRPSWFAFAGGFRRSKLNNLLKGALDVAFAAVGVVVFTPVMLLITLVIRLDSSGPVLYRQRRVGYRGRLFNVLKFRSMVDNAEEQGSPQWAEEDDPRVTRAGKFLRKYRLDELPQFLNVLRGEMSLVGPRPERPEFVELLRQKIPFYDERHSVRPGITGWAQVQYGYGGNFDDSVRKLEFDLFYLQNNSVLFDFVVLLKTVRIVLFGRGR